MGNSDPKNGDLGQALRGGKPAKQQIPTVANRVYGATPMKQSWVLRSTLEKKHLENGQP